MKFALVIVMATLAAVSPQKPLCLITAPNIIHLDTEETVTVQVHGATKPASITLFFKKQVSMKGGAEILSKKETVLLNEHNDYQTVVKLKLEFSTYKKVQPLFYIQLVAESNDILADGKYMKNIILSSRKGYIFIQTDKPIYTPGENANFRIFTLNQYMLPTDEAMNLRILNSKGLMVYDNTVKSMQIYQQRIPIPDVEPAGHWKIIAWFTHLPMSNTTVEFEVRQYVLPSFEVKIEALKPYYLLKEDSFDFRVSARYTYGKGLNGIAYVRFALMDEHGSKTHLPGLEMQTAVKDGGAQITLRTEDLREKADNRTTEPIEGHRLYIAVTVLETASGELEEAESSTVKIVSMPYEIDVSKTKQYFTPEGKLFILASTVYPDGTPVPHPQMKATVEVTGGAGESFHLKASGNEDGETVFNLKVPKQAESLNIEVFAVEDTGDAVLGRTRIRATAIASLSQSYLSIELPHVVLKDGQEMNVIFRDITPAGLAKPTHIYYLVWKLLQILNKGKVVQAKRVQRTELTSITLPFSYDLTPSFRIVAYYYIKRGGEWTIVTDSMWVDAQDVCEGQMQIVPFKRDYKPAEKMNVEVRMDQGDRVALAAVDTAVYILNKQNKLTSQKATSFIVAFNFLSLNLNIHKNPVTMFDYMNSYDLACSMGGGKDHLSVLNDAGLTFISNIKNMDNSVMRQVSGYRKPEEKKCCNDGVKFNHLKLSCEERLTKTLHQSPACREVFYKCCKAAKELREKIRRSKKSYSLARSFCVAKPQPLRVFQNFFVSLKLPYSVKRNEQLEVKAVVYNYRTEPLEVTVHMLSVEGLCSAGDGRDKQVVTVPGNSAVPVYFVVVPLIIGNIPIQVTAYSSNDLTDRIRKDLKVVGEGELISLHHEYNLDAKAAISMEIEIPAPLKSIPGEESDAFISVKGGAMGESVENCLNLDGVNRLIALPTGCAEQTMVKMSPAIQAIQYLDATNQWISLRAERRDEALEMIQSGYNRILRYKKDDGSYGAFETTPSSIWLTAFVAKELIRCRNIIPVQDSYILESISYLVSKQLDNGAFNDPHPVYDRSMQGGVGGVEGDVSLTSFVLVTLHHSLKVQSTEQSTPTIMAMQKAEEYLSKKLNLLQRPFAVAITAYALSLTAPGSNIASLAQSRLRLLANCDDKNDTCHWEASEDLRLKEEKKASGVPQANAISVETTAYALLQTLLGEDWRYAARIAKWLTEQRQYGGGFRSTQDTVVALEALSKYSMLSNDVVELDMRVDFCLPSGAKKSLVLNKQNALTSPAIQVIQTYRTMKRTDSHCGYYHLNVTVEGEVKYKKNDYEDGLDDYYNYEEGEDGTAQKDEPWSRIEWFDLRSRRKRHAPEADERESSLIYTVCAGTKAGNATGMAIVDISLLSGLDVNLQDLEDLTENPDCVMFRAKQITPIGLVQPASAVVYDYYNPERRCGIFYSAPEQSTMISKLCKEEVCACAEGHCPKIKVTFSKNMEKSTRSNYACFSPIVDYVYLVKIVQTREDGVFQYYTVTVTKVLQTSKDKLTSRGAMREMIHRKSCSEFEMKRNSDYLMMGKDATIADTTDSNGNYQYILNSDVWVEEIPEERKCQATKNRRACQLLHDFLQQYELNQCHS
ncbi:complement C4-B-like [Scleropages formosus]|uniref:Complement C4-B-like n=1 Tax=Scleropages formosus TaxID=113540 RepID=A0A0P7Z1C6_SCLFO|nr:complement C4-B-like [Scleropages formosus]